MESIAIIGAGGHGREVLMVLSHINLKSPHWKIEGFFDDGVSKGTVVNGFPVLGNIDALTRHERRLGVVVAVGSPAIKKQILNAVDNENLWFPQIIHPTTIMPPQEQLRLGAGVVMGPGVLIGPNVEIGHHVLLGSGVTVGHDTCVGNFTSVMAGAVISGTVGIGDGVFIGVGASIINNVDIGANTVIAAGSVVFNSMAPNCTVMGMPARSVQRKNP